MTKMGSEAERSLSSTVLHSSPITSTWNFELILSMLYSRISSASCEHHYQCCNNTYFESLFPYFSVKGLLEVLGGLCQVVGVIFLLRVYIRQALREWTFRNLPVAKGYFAQVCLVVEGVAESLTHVDIGEEIAGIPLPSSFSAAHQVFVTLNGNGEAEEEYRVGHLR